MVIDVNIGFLNRKILIFSGILALLLVVVLLVLFLFVFRGSIVRKSHVSGESRSKIRYRKGF